MEAMRWTGSDRKLMDASDADDLAIDVAMEIQHGQYDGYKCMNPYLAKAIAYYLASLTERMGWRIQTDIDDANELQYRVWVQR